MLVYPPEGPEEDEDLLVGQRSEVDDRAQVVVIFVLKPPGHQPGPKGLVTIKPPVWVLYELWGTADVYGQVRRLSLHYVVKHREEPLIVIAAGGPVLYFIEHDTLVQEHHQPPIADHASETRPDFDEIVPIGVRDHVAKAQVPVDVRLEFILTLEPPERRLKVVPTGQFQAVRRDGHYKVLVEAQPTEGGGLPANPVGDLTGRNGVGESPGLGG